jgi:hypothetical protein
MTLEVQIMIVVDHLQVEGDGVALHSTTALHMILFFYICDCLFKSAQRNSYNVLICLHVKIPENNSLQNESQNLQDVCT